ncbi:phosphoribosylanthranilate isomerase [Staphylococcus taiwanensis]|nr:phosphoribosylanthranilate isomerase [Staphylococcus taiwanensis]
MILKYCGFKSEQEVLNCIDLNIDMIGFIHYPKSKRHVTLNQLNALSRLVPKHIDKVAVLVNPSYQEVQQIIQYTSINSIQLHGDESSQFINKVKLNFKNIKIIKALPANESLKMNLTKYKNDVDLFIIDTPSEHYGGTGKSFDWQRLRHINIEIPYLIAGGLSASKIEKIQKLNINSHSGYDISSGIETNNYKDKSKMIQIINQVKGAV